MEKNKNFNSDNISGNIRENSINENDSNIPNCRCVGRICNVQKNMFTILFEGKELPAKCKGSIYYGNEVYPIVGDYVDYCFIVCSLNDNFNVNRILRYIAVAKTGEVTPVVVLTKADLCENVKDYMDEVKAATGDVRVYAVSAVRQEGMSDLLTYCRSGVTIALMGSSGVGKSTLINAISGSEVMKTGAVRESDSRGRHTTTTRQLFELPNGVTIVDTPGMREIGMCDVEEGLDDTFADIVELEGCCKFSDCRHETEPGCAIKAAIADGRLSAERYELYKSLKNESARNFDRKAVAVKRRQINKGRH